MDPTKPGNQTSEFQVSVINSIVSAVIALVALIHPGFHISSEVQGLIIAIAVGAIGLISSVYATGRSRVKAAAFSGPNVSNVAGPVTVQGNGLAEGGQY